MARRCLARRLYRGIRHTCEGQNRHSHDSFL